MTNINKRVALMATFTWRGVQYDCTRKVKEKLQKDADFVFSLSEKGMKQAARGAYWALLCDMSAAKAAGVLRVAISEEAAMYAS